MNNCTEPKIVTPRIAELVSSSGTEIEAKNETVFVTMSFSDKMKKPGNKFLRRFRSVDLFLF